MSETKDFHIGDVLSVAAEWLVSPNHISGVYAVLDFMEGWSHFTHQLPDASLRVRTAILEQYPMLSDSDALDPGDFFDAATTKEEGLAMAEQWCHLMAVKFGLPMQLTLTRTALSPPEDPIDSLADKVGAEKIYVLPVAPAGSSEGEQPRPDRGERRETGS